MSSASSVAEGGRLVQRSTSDLRPHPTYWAVCERLVEARVREAAQGSRPITRPLLTTSSGLILDGHVRWQVAKARHEASLPCLVIEVNDEDALPIVIQEHQGSAGLNPYCRILMALELEAKLQEPQKDSSLNPKGSHSSNLTTKRRTDGRTAVARLAGVSTGNVTKVKQILQTAIPVLQEQLRRGKVRIHRAWLWRSLTPKAQEEALNDHLHNGDLKASITKLVHAHQPRRRSAEGDVDVSTLQALCRLGQEGLRVAVADVPGRAVLVSRTVADELRALVRP